MLGAWLLWGLILGIHSLVGEGAVQASWRRGEVLLETRLQRPSGLPPGAGLLSGVHSRVTNQQKMHRHPTHLLRVRPACHLPRGLLGFSLQGSVSVPLTVSVQEKLRRQ